MISGCLRGPAKTVSSFARSVSSPGVDETSSRDRDGAQATKVQQDTLAGRRRRGGKGFQFFALLTGYSNVNSTCPPYVRAGKRSARRQKSSPRAGSIADVTSKGAGRATDH